MSHLPLLFIAVSIFLLTTPARAVDLHEQAIAEQRALLQGGSNHPEARQRLAEIGWSLAGAIEHAEAMENAAEAASIKRHIESSLPDIVWRTRHTADHASDPRAQLAQATFLRLGILMDSNPREACKYYRKLSASGDAIGHWQYSRCVQPIDQNTALQLAQSAADGGHPAAIQFVAERGLTSKDAATRKQSVELLRKAAAQGRPSAVLLLGALHETGTAVRADLDAAAVYYRQIANQGHVVAQNNLGALMQRKGDTDAAARWYRMAAEARLPVAQLNLGLLLAGEGSEDCEAVRWIRMAADTGLEMAGRVLKDPEPYQIDCKQSAGLETRP